VFVGVKADYKFIFAMLFISQSDEKKLFLHASHMRSLCVVFTFLFRLFVVPKPPETMEKQHPGKLIRFHFPEFHFRGKLNSTNLPECFIKLVNHFISIVIQFRLETLALQEKLKLKNEV